MAKNMVRGQTSSSGPYSLYGHLCHTVVNARQPLWSVSWWGQWDTGLLVRKLTPLSPTHSSFFPFLSLFCGPWDHTHPQSTPFHMLRRPSSHCAHGGQHLFWILFMPAYCPGTEWVVKTPTHVHVRNTRDKATFVVPEDSHYTLLTHRIASVGELWTPSRILLGGREKSWWQLWSGLPIPAPPLCSNRLEAAYLVWILQARS